ncbi:hypothetical protein COBT_002904, partial [Conglomerata obtusa]
SIAINTEEVTGYVAFDNDKENTTKDITQKNQNGNNVDAIRIRRDTNNNESKDSITVPSINTHKTTTNKAKLLFSENDFKPYYEPRHFCFEKCPSASFEITYHVWDVINDYINMLAYKIMNTNPHIYDFKIKKPIHNQSRNYDHLYYTYKT